MSTIRDADRIAVVENGGIAEIGTYWLSVRMTTIRMIIWRRITMMSVPEIGELIIKNF